MSFNFSMSGSTIAFNFIAAAASGDPIIVSPTTLTWNSGSAAHFFTDTFFGVDWRVTGDLPSFSVSPATVGANPLAQVRGILDIPAGQVVATFSGRVKAADGTSSYLTLDFLQTADWGDFFDLGKDIVTLGPGPDSLNALAGNDSINGLGGTDTLLGGVGKDTIKGGGGADSIEGNGGRDRLFGGNGGDTMEGDGGNDVMKGQKGSDAMSGGPGRDFMEGGGGSDLIGGGPGRDTMRGDGGADTLILDGGDDLAYGGAGADTFRIDDAGNRVARIYHFKDDVDALEFSTAIFNNVDAVIDATSPGSGRVRIDMGDNGTLVVAGITDPEALRDDIGFF